MPTLTPFLCGRPCQALEGAAQGSGEFTMPGSVQNPHGCGNWGHGLVVNMVVLLEGLDNFKGLFQPHQFHNSDQQLHT